MAEIYLPKKLKFLEQIFHKLTDPNKVVNSEEWQKIAKNQEFLADIVDTSEKWQQATAELAEVREIFLQSGDDLELKEVAATEIRELETKITQLTEQLNILLLPCDPNDKQNVFLEVVAIGGEEAGRWAGDLMRMYYCYAESQNWKVKLVSESLADTGGIKEAILEIEGDSVYGKLKFETGIHQLKTTPVTQCSTTTNNLVATRIKVIPQPNPEVIVIQPTEIEVYTRNSTSCRCNACVCKTDIGVQIFHQPTEIRITCTEERSQLQNRDKAIQILRAKLYEMKLAEQQQEITSIERSPLTAEKCSEIIRTYDYQNRHISDRCWQQDFSWTNSLGRDLEIIIQSYIKREQRERLAALANSVKIKENLNS